MNPKEGGITSNSQAIHKQFTSNSQAIHKQFTNNSQTIHKAMNMALDEGYLFGITRLLIWDYKAAYLGLQGCLFGITRPNGLEEIDIGQYVSKVSEVDL
jgi:hypothetical protein